MNATATTARAFLDGILTSPLIESAAVGSHNGWRAGKTADLNDSTNPFLGAGPSGKRQRVRDFNRDELAALLTAAGKNESAADASGGSDVYNPIYVGFEELPQNTRDLNTVPMLATVYGLNELLPPEATLEQLRNLLTDVINGSDKAAIETINRTNHTAFQAFQLALGARGYGDSRRDDFVVYDSLTNKLQELDGYTSKPAAEKLLELVNEALNS